MGSYLNPGSKRFRESLNSQIYVDKTGLIEKTNKVLNTEQKCVCQPSKKIWEIYGCGYAGSLL